MCCSLGCLTPMSLLYVLYICLYLFCICYMYMYVFSVPLYMVYENKDDWLFLSCFVWPCHCIIVFMILIWFLIYNFTYNDFGDKHQFPSIIQIVQGIGCCSCYIYLSANILKLKQIVSAYQKQNLEKLCKFIRNINKCVVL
jgi:hypothetical protein